MNAWLDDLARTLPRQFAVVDALRTAVEADERFRWMLVGCSLGTGRGDELSDIDGAVGYDPAIDAGALMAVGTDLVHQAGAAVDVLGHDLFNDPTSPRFATEFDNGVQLDLVLMSAPSRPGHLPDEVMVVDKDGTNTTLLDSPHNGSPSPGLAREWVMLGWWSVSDSAKYLRRGSLNRSRSID